MVTKKRVIGSEFWCFFLKVQVFGDVSFGNVVGDLKVLRF